MNSKRAWLTSGQGLRRRFSHNCRSERFGQWSNRTWRQYRRICSSSGHFSPVERPTGSKKNLLLPCRFYFPSDHSHGLSVKTASILFCRLVSSHRNLNTLWHSISSQPAVRVFETWNKTSKCKKFCSSTRGTQVMSYSTFPSFLTDGL